MNRQEIVNMKPEKKISHYHFSLKAILGKGSYGTVYFGRDTINQNCVALKVIDNSKCLNSQVQYAQLSKEIEIMKKLKHPNIVQFFESYYTQNNIYVITEYCNGPDLRQFLAQQQTIQEEQAITMIKQIASGLKEIVSNNFIHRDLKPANILMHDGICKIADFGFSRPLPQDTVMESLVGTPLYMAPQILTKQQYTQKCDVWSLGLIYYEMLFGTLPFMATNYMELIWKICNTKVKFPTNKQISENSKKFILGCLQRDEVNRFSWNEVFLHPLIKPQIKIQIDQGVREIFSPKFATHRATNTDKSALPLLRERSCSGKNLQQKVEPKIEQKIETKQDVPSTSSQSTECEEILKQGKYYMAKAEKPRRTKSNFEQGKTNQTDINLKKQIPQPLPSNGGNNFIKVNFMIKKTQQQEKLVQQAHLKTKPLDFQQQQLLQAIYSLEKEKVDNKEFEAFLSKEKNATLNLVSNYSDRARIAGQFLEKLPEKPKKKLEVLINILNQEHENTNGKK